MFAVRSAMLVLALGFLAKPSAASASSGTSSSGRDGTVAACQLDSSITRPDFVPLPDPSTFARLVRRKGHLRAALEETDHELEEADLGPVYIPRGHHSRPPIHFASPPIPTTCRLRC
jgi:hypothetical protein